jgi:hypothetical protein
MSQMPLDPGPLDDADDAVLRDLRHLWGRLDPAPAGLADRAKFALTMHSLEAELAELTRDELVLTRLDDDVARAESVTFTSSRVSILVTVSVLSATTARVEGWVTTRGATVRAQTTGGELSETTDDNGRFCFESVARGSVRFVVWPQGDAAERPVVTPSIDV